MAKVIKSISGDLASNIDGKGKPLVLGNPSRFLPQEINHPEINAFLTTGLGFFHPNLVLNNKGNGVKALQLLVNGYLGKKLLVVDGDYGLKTANGVHQLKVAIYHLGRPGDGNSWGGVDWAKVQGYVKAHKAILDFLNLAQADSQVSSLRSRVVAAAWYGFNHRFNILYGEVRPYPSSLSLAGNQKIVTDCSGFVTLCYKMGGASDPNGRSYDGYGYTGTLQQYGRIIGQNQLQPGDLCFYGDQGGGIAVHTAIFVGNGMVISNGLYPMQYAPVNLWNGLSWNSARSYL